MVTFDVSGRLGPPLDLRVFMLLYPGTYEDIVTMGYATGGSGAVFMLTNMGPPEVLPNLHPPNPNHSAIPSVYNHPCYGLDIYICTISHAGFPRG